MKAERTAHGTLVVTETSTSLSIVLGIIIAGSLAALAAPFVISSADNTLLQTGMIGVLLALVVLYLFWEYTVFEFNPLTQCVTWRRRRLLTTAAGTTPFLSIRDVIVEPSALVGSRPAYRIILVTEQGVLPLTNTYRRDKHGREHIANQIRSVLMQTSGL